MYSLKEQVLTGRKRRRNQLDLYNNNVNLKVLKCRESSIGNQTIKWGQKTELNIVKTENVTHAKDSHCPRDPTAQGVQLPKRSYCTRGQLPKRSNYPRGPTAQGVQLPKGSTCTRGPTAQGVHL
ncbi:hypothetical protein PoB_003501400 [Plakobranchus ocellatus]|uniref:Uncharacterized protein n=1 Tax=Plakobranchus ocellatus TaxID=259542 RepID=A0AAV4AL91_9GAST|nr:hypothetical protein PoB_003501400 [Plakobranchus ocellatus]